MDKIRCLIIEDEPLAADIIVDYISQIPFLELISTCTSATQALGVLKDQSIDLIFLDLHLPGLKGFDFVRTLRNPPQIIVTSAYQQYALEGYELDIVDYLLKPIDFQRFVQAINRIKKPEGKSDESTTPDQKKEMIILKEGRNNVPVLLSDIRYIEGQRDYLLVYTQQGMIKTKSTLSAFEQRLDPTDFVRIHKSFIVAKRLITSFSKSQLTIGTEQLPVGRKYAEIVKGIFSDSKD